MSTSEITGEGGPMGHPGRCGPVSAAPWFGIGYLHGSADWHVLYSIASTKKRLSRMHRLQLPLDMVNSGDSRALIVQTRSHEVAFYACIMHKRF
jgi:hypothetical protein